MNFWTQLAFIVVASLVATWLARARLMAMFVSWLVTRQDGVNVKLESLTLSGATQVLVTFSRGCSLVKDVQCRRIKIGWITTSRSELDRSPSSDGGSDGEEEAHMGSGVQKMFLSLSRLRVHINLVGVRVRLRADRTASDGAGRGDVGGTAEGLADSDGGKTDPRPGTVKRGDWNVQFLMKRVLPFVSVDLHDVEVSSYASAGRTTKVLLKGRKVGVDMQRSEQVAVMEHIFVCPGARGVKGETVYHECGLVELDSASLTSASSLHDLLGGLKPSRRKRSKMGKTHCISLDVNSLRINLDPTYLQHIQAVFGAGSRLPEAAAEDHSKSDADSSANGASGGAISRLYSVCAEGASPISLQTAISSATIQIPFSGCDNQIGFKGVSSSCQISPSRGEAREGTMEFSLSWDGLSMAVGLKDAAAVQCQSSRAEVALTLGVSHHECSTEKMQDDDQIGALAIRLEGGADVGALHTKVHHEHIRRWLEAVQDARRARRTRKRRYPANDSSKQQATTSCHVKLSIGNGSSLQFVDSAGACMLHQSLDAAALTVKRYAELFEAKFDVSGIAMAEETQDSRNESQVTGGIQRLSQVLSNRSFSGSMALDEHGDTAFSVSVSSLSGKISNKLMENVCKIGQSVLDAMQMSPDQPVATAVEAGEALETEISGSIKEKYSSGDGVLDQAASAVETTRTRTSNGRRRFSVRVDLLDVDLAVLSSYVVEKHQSSVNMRKVLKSAVALRIKNFGARTVAGLCKANSETVSVLYYEGVSEESFSLDFDSMEGLIHSKPLTLDGLQLDDVISRLDAESEECERRVTLGPLHAYIDADAIISMVHFSKFLDTLTVGRAHLPPRTGGQSLIPSWRVKTTVAVKEVAVCAPISSDREIAVRISNAVLDHGGKNNAMRVTEAAVLIKGVETFVTKGVQLSIVRNDSRDRSNEKVTASLHFEDFQIVLPYDRDPGPTLKLFSLYVKACKQLVDDIRGANRVNGRSSPAPESSSSAKQGPNSDGETVLIELDLELRVTSGKFVFQHHPLERWFASHSNTIRHAALVEHLWDEAHASVMSEGDVSSSPLHSGKSQREKEASARNRAVSVARPKSWRNLMSRHASAHLEQIASNNKALKLYEELFELEFNDIMLHAASNPIPGAALAFVHAVDDPSQNVGIIAPMLFDICVSGSTVDVKFGGCNRPLYSGTGMVVEGKVAFAKQATAAPETCRRVLHVGIHHVKEINVPLRGTCPPVKLFTDVSLQTESSSVFFSPGLEPVLGLMGITSKRLVPTDPDSVSKKPPPVPWWDDIRYFWRGRSRIASNELHIVLLPGLAPTFSYLSERLEVNAKDIDVTINAGKLCLETGILRMMAFRRTLEENGQLCVFPVADVKSMVAEILVSWKLPNGADPNNHYIFPSEVPERQSPVFVADVFKASSLDVVVDVSLRRTVEGVEPPILYIGGEIVSFWRKFVKDWEIPTFIKSQVRRGTFFVRKPKLAFKKKGLPKLLRGFTLKVASDELRLTHFTLDGKDPGGGLVMSTTGGQWEFAWDCNKEIKSFLSNPPNVKCSGDFPPQPTKTIMSYLAVNMEHVTVKSLQFSADSDSTTPRNIFRQERSGTDPTIEALSSESPRAASEDSVDSHWLADRVVIVKSTSDEVSRFGEPIMKPLKVTVNGCYFMTDLELRDAIWATVEHLIAAFAPSDSGTTIGSLRSAPTHGMPSHRSYSRQSDVSNDEEDNELLNLLLRQKHAEGSGPLASPQANVELDRHESTHAEVDIMPMTSSHDDSSSEIKYEVEVSNLQLILQRDHEMGTSRGRLLLATKSATLRGATTDTHSITTLDMEEVQAYISLSSIDPSADIVWLETSDEANEFIAPSVEDRESIWRRVFNPINMNLRHSKYMTSTLTRYVHQHQLSGSPARQGEELLLKIPEIAAVMDGREFEVLIDVVSFLITSGPTVHTCNSVRNLRRDAIDNSKVANDQMLLEMSSRQLGCIRGEAAGLLAAMPDSHPSDIWSLSEPLPFSGALTVYLDAPEASEDQPSEVLRKYIEQGKEIRHNATLLLRWSQEQEALALEDYNLTKSRLEETSESLKRQTQVKSASRVLIHLNRVVWQLCDQERVPFVQASIRKVLFDRRRNRDRSGSVRFTIHRLDVLDATGILPEGPATSAGVILTNWNPDTSYDREPMLRVISTLGVPTSKYDVFEHLDATLHPLTLHLTEQIATACWEYFFPKEDQKSRQEAFSTSMNSRKFAPTIQPSPRKSSFTASDNLSEVSSPLGKQESDVSSRSEALGLTRLSSPGMKRKDSPVIKRKNSALRLQKRFKYVKLNRAHMRITYAGKPIGIKDRVLVINSYTCENLDGTWRDLLSNVKQKAIFSALFSGLGLQGRKVKELMIGAAPSIKSVELPKSEEEDLANNRGLLAKFGLKQGNSHSGTSQRRKSDDPETQKKRALFGESIMHRLHRRATSNASSPRGDGQGTPSSPPANPYSIPRKHAVPLLELTKPLPKDDSSDSDGSIEGDGAVRIDRDDAYEVEVTNLPEDDAMLSVQDGPGPLGAGLAGPSSPKSSMDKSTTHSIAAGSVRLERSRSDVSSGAKAGDPEPRLSKYDPHAPPTWSTSQIPTSKRRAGPMESFRKK